MSSSLFHSAAATAAAACPTADSMTADPTKPAAAVDHAPGTILLQRSPPVGEASSKALAGHLAGEAPTDAAPPLPSPKSPAASGSGPPFSPGDTVWIPSAREGFTAATVLAVDWEHQRFLVRPHHAATAELCAAHGARSVGVSEQPATCQPHYQQAQEKAGKHHHTHPDRRDAQHQLGEQELLPILVPRNFEVDLKVTTTTASVDALDGAKRRGATTVQKENHDSASSDGMRPETYVRFTETWTYSPLPPPPAVVPEDAAALDSLSAASVLQLLHHRFLRNQIYTFAAHVLLAVNPCRTLPGLYGYDVVEVYRGWKGRKSAASAAAFLSPHVAQYLGLSILGSRRAEHPGSRRGEGGANRDSENNSIADTSRVEDTEACCTSRTFSECDGSRRHQSRPQSGASSSPTYSMVNTNATCSDSGSFATNRSSFPPAHPFAVAQDAHRRLRGEGQKQTIIVSGESGAGKTETSKILMLYLTEVGSWSPFSTCRKNIVVGKKKKGCQSITADTNNGACHTCEEDEQEELNTNDSENEGHSRQAQRRAAAAALLHAAAAKRGTCSSVSPAEYLPSPRSLSVSSNAFVNSISPGSPRAAAASVFSPHSGPPGSAAGEPSAPDMVSDSESLFPATTAAYSQKPAAEDLQQRILSCNPVLEAFCNAKTRRNNNSSRVGRLTLLHYDRAGLLHGASIRTYLLECTRVCCHPLWERNFHVFYQLLRGCSEKDLERRRLQRCCSAYQLLTPTPPVTATQQRDSCRGQARKLVVSAASPAAVTPSTPRDTAVAAGPPPSSPDEVNSDKDSYGFLVEALSKTGFSVAEIEELFDALAGLLHLSNVSFKEVPPVDAGATHALVVRQRSTAADEVSGSRHSSSSSSSKNGAATAAAAVKDGIPVLTCAADLLRLPLEQLKEVLLSETLTMRHETLRKQRRAEQAAAARDALIKCAYTRIVRFVLAKLNESVMARSQQPARQHPDEGQRCVPSSTITMLCPQSRSSNSGSSSSDINGTYSEEGCNISQADSPEQKTIIRYDSHNGRARSCDSVKGSVATALWGTGLSIGILDIYGFECLDGGANGFEQLCINYANERQQQVFLQRAISEELRLYRSEGLLGVLSSLQPALLSSANDTDNLLEPPALPLSPCLSPSSLATRIRAPISSHSTGDNTRYTHVSAGSSSKSGTGGECNLGTTWLLQRQRLYCEQQTEELLSYLTDGLFKRLDDNSRLRARGQQQRLDVHFWRDFFAFCRQREQQGQLQPPSFGKASINSPRCSRGDPPATQQQLQHQPPILFRLLRSGGGSSYAASVYSNKSEDGSFTAGSLRISDISLPQKHHEKMQQLLAAGEVRPLRADAAAAASTLQQGVFVVKHFAGLVEYRVDGWLARNNDKAESEIEDVLNFSRLRALQAAETLAADTSAGDGDNNSIRGLAAGWLLNARERSSSPNAAAAAAVALGGNTSANNNRHFASVCQQFVADLRQLMGDLQSSDVHLHFIRCFVSNRSMRPLQLDRALLLRQLQQSGTVALIHVLHSGYPHRLALSPLAAAFKSKLQSCIADVTAQLEPLSRRRERDDSAEAAAAKEQLKRIQALHVDHVPDGRLGTYAGESACGLQWQLGKGRLSSRLQRSSELLNARAATPLLLHRPSSHCLILAAHVGAHVFPLKARLAYLAFYCVSTPSLVPLRLPGDPLRVPLCVHRAANTAATNLLCATCIFLQRYAAEVPNLAASALYLSPHISPAAALRFYVYSASALPMSFCARCVLVCAWVCACTIDARRPQQEAVAWCLLLTCNFFEAPWAHLLNINIQKLRLVCCYSRLLQWLHFFVPLYLLSLSAAGVAVVAALGLLRECPRGAVSCGISLLFFKASAFQPATAFLRSPEAFFSQPDMLVRLQQELTRRRWKVAVAVAVHVRRSLAWLLRRVRLLHVIKQRFITCAIHALLLRRYILRPLLLRVQKRAGAAAGLKLLLRLLLARGFHTWVLACRRANEAEGAAHSLAARAAAVAAGKMERVGINQSPHLSQQRQVDNNTRALLRRLSHDGDEAEHHDTNAPITTMTPKDKIRSQAESEVPPSQPETCQSPGTVDKCTSEVGGATVSTQVRKRSSRPSLLWEAAKATANCWWRAALFCVSSKTTCRRGSPQPCTAHSTTSASGAAAMEATLTRECSETFLLFTGTQVYMIQLQITQQLQPQSELAARGLSSVIDVKEQQPHFLIHCFALLFASDIPPAARYGIPQSNCEEWTAWRTVDHHAERRGQQMLCIQKKPQQEAATPHLRRHQQSAQPQWHQKKDSQAVSSSPQEAPSSCKEAEAAHAAAAVDSSRNGEKFIRAPGLVCLAQHARYPQLFVVCDRQARIFLLPLHLPPDPVFSSVVQQLSASSSPVLCNASSYSDFSSSTTKECDTNRESAAAAAHSTAKKQSPLLQQQQTDGQQRDLQPQAVQHRLLQQRSPVNDSRYADCCSHERDKSWGSRSRSVQVETGQWKPNTTAKRKTEKHFELLCSNTSQGGFAQTGEKVQLPFWGEKSDRPKECIPKTEAVSYRGIAATDGPALPGGVTDVANSTSVELAAPASAQQPSLADTHAALAQSARSSPRISGAATRAAAGSIVSVSPELLRTNIRAEDRAVYPVNREKKAALATHSAGSCNSIDTCNRSNLPNTNCAVPHYGALCKQRPINCTSQTNCSIRLSGYTASQQVSEKEAGDVGRSFSRSASSLYVESEAATNSLCSSSSGTEKRRLKSVGRGQPSTWLPALVSATPDLPLCRRPATAAAPAVYTSPFSSAAAGNPYLSSFRRVSPLPAGTITDAQSSATIDAYQQYRQQHLQERKELCLRVTPWVEVKKSAYSSSVLLLPRHCCFPHTLGPAAWVPDALLERAEQRHEEAVLHHRNRHDQSKQQRKVREAQTSLLRHSGSDEQHEQEPEVRQRQPHPQQCHVTVRPVRIHFASSYSTQHVLVLAYVSAASSSTCSKRALGSNEAGAQRNTIRGELQQQHHGAAVVAGLWAVVLVDLLQQRALDWKEILAAESDVIRSARIHRRQLPLLFPHTIFGSYCRPSSDTTSSHNSTNGMEYSTNSCRDSSSNSGGGSSDDGNSYNSCSSAVTKTSAVSRDDKRSDISNTTTICTVSPSQIVSTGLLERLGEGLWVVAGPGLLGVLQIRLDQAGGSDRNYRRGKRSSSKECISTRAGGASDTKGSNAFLATHGTTPGYSDGKVEVLWNQARVQHISRRRTDVPAADAAPATRSSFDVASTWFTGCMHTATPLGALQDVGPTHPLLTCAALEPNSKAALLLQQHFQHLLLLTSATGDLWLLRWLPERRRLRLLRRVPLAPQQEQPESSTIVRRFIRMQYADAYGEEEEMAAAEQLFSSRQGSPCCHNNGRECTACFPVSPTVPAGTGVLRLSQVHPHARKQLQECYRTDREGLSLHATSTATHRQRNSARGKKKVAPRRWLDDIGAIVECTQESAQPTDCAPPTIEGLHATATDGSLGQSNAQHGGAVPVPAAVGATPIKSKVQIMHLHMPPLVKKEKKRSAASDGTRLAERKTLTDGCLTSADSSTSEGEAFSGRSSEELSGMASPESFRHRNSDSSLGDSICGSDGGSQSNSNWTPKECGGETAMVHPSVSVPRSQNELVRSHSQLSRAEPQPQQPDAKQQQQHGRRKQRPHREHPAEKGQALLQQEADGPTTGMHSEKDAEALKREARASSSPLLNSTSRPATATDADLLNNDTFAQATLTEGHVVAVAPLQSLRDSLVVLRTTEKGEPQLAVVNVENVQQPTWRTLSLQ